MSSQVISGRFTCPYCYAQQARQSRANLRHSPALPARQRHRLHRAAQTVKQEEQASTEEDSRAEARRRRRESRQAVETTINVDPADTEMMTEDEPLPQSGAHKQAPQSEAQRQAKELLSRKSQLIMQFTQAGSSLESVIQENRQEIDEVLLKLLARRAQAAAKMEEEKSAVEGLMLLWQRLHAEMQRMRASPATRLLDQVLQVMNPASGLALQDRQQAAEALLRRSFSAPGSRPVDIFGVAAALAEGQDFEAEADELAKEFVPKQAFLQEANELLEGALETQQGLERDLQSGVAKDKQQEAQELVRNRRMAIVQLQEMIALAKSIRT